MKFSLTEDTEANFRLTGNLLTKKYKEIMPLKVWVTAPGMYSSKVREETRKFIELGGYKFSVHSCSETVPV